MGSANRGWEYCLSPDGRVFYINHRLKGASWAVRCHDRIPNMLTDFHQMPALPSGWKMCLSKDDHVYFVNHNKRISTWDDPRDRFADDSSVIDKISSDIKRNLRVSDSSQEGISSTPSRSPSSRRHSRRHSRQSSRDWSRFPKENIKHDKYDAELKASLKAAILTKSTKIKWEDIAGLDEAKHALQGAVLLPIKFPEAFQFNSKSSRRGILLYGPPGTGKSLLAKALAAESDLTFFSISSSDIESKWVGESQRKVRLLFELARENSPSIIFIDEVDSLCSNRSSDSNDNRSGMKTELLVQLDGVGHDNSGIFILAATNVPWTLDTALLSRFQRKIYIPLPHDSARKSQLRMNTVFKFSPNDLEYVVKGTKGLSGRDIDILLQESFETAKTRILKAQYFCKIISNGKRYFEPCNSFSKGAIQMTWQSVPSGMLQRPIPRPEDILGALDKIKATVSVEDAARFREWTDRFGSNGS